MKWTVFRELVNTCILTLLVILLHNRGRASVSASFEINQLALSRDRQKSTFLSFVYPFLKKLCAKNAHFSLFSFSLPQIFLFLLSPFTNWFTSKILVWYKISYIQNSTVLGVNVSMTHTQHLPYIHRCSLLIHRSYHTWLSKLLKTPSPFFSSLTQYTLRQDGAVVEKIRNQRF